MCKTVRYLFVRLSLDTVSNEAGLRTSRSAGSGPDSSHDGSRVVGEMEQYLYLHPVLYNETAHHLFAILLSAKILMSVGMLK